MGGNMIQIKVCPLCQFRYSPDFNVCVDCNADLIILKKNKKQKWDEDDTEW